MRSTARARSMLGAVLAALGASACVVSFEGYELASNGGAAGGGGTSSGGASPGGSAGLGGGGATGGGAGVGGVGGATGGSGGSTTGGAGGATGGSGGTATGGSGGATGGIGGTTGGSGGSATGGGGTTGGSGGTATGGSGGTTGGSGGTGGGTGGGPTCPSVTGTTAMVLVPGPTKTLCIDKMEVTQQQYSAFLSTNPPTTGQPTECSGNTSFAPSSSCTFTPGSTPTKPVACVDWCDAVAYCKAAGKRLCGKIGGGPVALGSGADAAQSQWFNACSQNGQRLYPYGSLYDGFACVGLDNTNFYLPQNVGTQALCQGGYTEIYDMSGNVEEWEDSCSGSTCAVRGGHYLSAKSSLACAAAATAGRMSSDKTRGFRCCAD